MTIDNLSVRIRNFKCFGEDDQGFSKILPINLIIGKNNSGKSTLLDVISYLTLPSQLVDVGHRGTTPQVFLARALSSTELEYGVGRVVQNASGSTAPTKYVGAWAGKPIVWEVKPGSIGLVSIEPPFRSSPPPFGLELLPRLEEELLNQAGNPFRSYTFKRLLADRDLIPEVDGGPAGVDPNGAGATRTIQHFITKTALPRALVEETLLNDLNSIFQPDGVFTRILVQRLPNDLWEVFLHESGKGSVPISRSGSGVKTVLLVLVFVHLIPHLDKRDLSDYLFGFEELENNLHPALQRRLLLYLDKVANERKCHFFLTTHSSVAIDLFAKNDSAQIVHVTHNGEKALARGVSSYGESQGILDDLDIRASDLLQANGIVWVEGPSDRLYFNRWIELWFDGKIKETAHYQCVYYGGSLLSHLSVDDPDINIDDLVKILRVNRNAILMLDSDRKLEADPLNPTKDRIIDEITRMGGMVWVTAGRTIENYLDSHALSRLYVNESVPLQRYQDLSEYLDGIKDGEGKRFARSKVQFARRVLPHLTKEGIEESLDLLTQVVEAGKRICAWNGLGDPN